MVRVNFKQYRLFKKNVLFYFSVIHLYFLFNSTSLMKSAVVRDICENKQAMIQWLFNCLRQVHGLVKQYSFSILDCYLGALSFILINWPTIQRDHRTRDLIREERWLRNGMLYLQHESIAQLIFLPFLIITGCYYKVRILTLPLSIVLFYRHRTVCVDQTVNLTSAML